MSRFPTRYLLPVSILQYTAAYLVIAAPPGPALEGRPLPGADMYVAPLFDQPHMPLQSPAAGLPEIRTSIAALNPPSAAARSGQRG